MAYGCTITVDTGKIPSSQSNFVWLATEDNFPTAAIDGGATSILNGGGNLRCYTDDTKTTQLPIEVVTFVTGGTPSVQVWGLSPTLAVASTVYIEADTVATTQPAVTDTYGRNAVWVDYEAVYHLNESSTTSFVDSAGNHANATSSGTGLSSTTGAYSGNGVASTGLTTISTGININASTQKSISSWIKFSDVDGVLLGRGELFGSTGDPRLYAGIRNNTTWGAGVGDSFLPDPSTAIAVTDDTWAYMAVVSDGTTGRTYLNGVAGPTITNTYSGTNANDWSMLGLDGISNFYITGAQQSARIENFVMTANRLLGEYNNQSSPSTFWSTGAWEQQGATGTTVTINETGPSFTESINTNLSVNITGNITENGPAFTESISATLSTLTIQADITETGPGFTDSISATVTPSLIINASITEQGPSFTENINANLDVNLSATISELGPSFTESINVNVTTEIDANITEFGPSFSENISVAIPIKITVNPKNLVRVKRKSNTVRIKRKSNIVRVK